MKETAISVILLVIGSLFLGYLRAKQAQVDVVEAKNDALEKAAEKQRTEEAKKDEKEATEVVSSGVTSRALDFLRNSFGKSRDRVQAPKAP